MSADTALDDAFLTTVSPWGIPVQVLAETNSSNDELLRQGKVAAVNGSLLVAEMQTAGRGQFHRPWASNNSLGLWFSLLLRIEINDATIPVLSAFAAVAIVETLGELGVCHARIKPPNDVYLAGHKIAGILVETRTGKNPFAVVGIGLNVNQQRRDFPPELQSTATSLALSQGKNFDRNHVAALLLKALGLNEQLMRHDPTTLLARWNSLLLNASSISTMKIME